MKVTVEDVSSVKKIINIEVSEDEVVKKLDDKYKELKQNAKVKGFRPGKTPRSVLEKLYAKTVNPEITSKLIEDSFSEALKEKGFGDIIDAKVDSPELKNKEPYQYTARIEIRPVIQDIDFKGIELKKKLYKVSQQEIDDQLKRLQKNMAKLEPIQENRPVREGDFVVIDYEGFLDGKPFSETEKTENFSMKVGDNKVSEELEKQIIGMEPGQQRNIKVKFPQDYVNKKIANLEIEFAVKLNEISYEVLPEINDEFAKKLGQYTSIEQVKETITKDLQTGYDNLSENELHEQIFQALIDQTDFELPDRLVDYELEGIIKEAEMRFNHNNISLEQIGLTKEIMSEKYRDTAEKQVRRHLLLEKIAAQEKLELSDQEIEQGINNMAEVCKVPSDHMKKMLNENKTQLESIKISLLEKRAMELILNHSKIQDIEPENKVISE